MLGIAGTLRRGSYNGGLLEAAQQVAPPDVTITVFDIADVPFYEADVEGEAIPSRSAC
jgi:chromate reductase, NAD(P)H dehydrogenase (quinone)